jgi:hypothetical protein
MDGMLHVPAFRLIKLAHSAELRVLLYQQPCAIGVVQAWVGQKRLNYHI